jgi:hypothetical protein
MAQPIYKVWFMKYTEPWYKLTTDEQNNLMSLAAESLKQVGAEVMVMCLSVWASESWLGWGVEKYPDLEAVQKHTQNLFALNWFKYIESTTTLGTEMPQD